MSGKCDAPFRFQKRNVYIAAAKKAWLYCPNSLNLIKTNNADLYRFNSLNLIKN